MATEIETARILRSAFPAKLASEVDVVLGIIPAGLLRPSVSDRQIRMGAEMLTVLGRIYSPEPAHPVDHLTALQKTILSALYTRHQDGFVRERHVRLLLGVDEPWLPPFVITLLGEYVIEICALIADHVTTMPRRTYAEFATENPNYVGLTRSRIVSYRNCYHRAMPMEKYPAYRAMTSLGLWEGPEARRLIMRPAVNPKTG